MTRRKTVLIVVATLLLIGAGAAVWNRLTHRNVESAAEHGVFYQCPMHPSVVSDKPGNCSICGMTLVKRSGSRNADVAGQIASSAKMEPGTGGVDLSPSQQVLANVRTTKVGLSSTASAGVVATGRVTFDERRTAQVTSYTAGRIEQLFVNFTGQPVRRGAVVATIYSPDLYATQQEYLLALANRKRMSTSGFGQAESAANNLVTSTERRLILFGMSRAQVDALARRGTAAYTTNIVSPVAGVVTQKLVVPQQYVAQGQPLLQVTDLSVVWVEADVFEQDLARVVIGQRAEVTVPALPGVTLPGTVAFTQPTMSGDTRTTRVRIELPNRDLALKPDMFVSVRLSGGTTRPALTVPLTALIDRGQRQFVWIQSSPGKFEPRQVTVGARTGEQAAILSGLSGGETVVVEGGFLLDSEAQLRSAQGVGQ